MMHKFLTRNPILINVDKYEYINCCDERIQYAIDLDRVINIIQKNLEYVIEPSRIEDISLLIIETYVLLYNLKEEYNTENFLEIMGHTLKNLEVNNSDIVDVVESDDILLLNTLKHIPSVLGNPGVIHIIRWNKYDLWSVCVHIGECYEYK